MPRTTWRYAIEHLPEAQWKRALRGLFEKYGPGVDPEDRQDVFC
jgi:hypothetical protein